MTHFAATIVLIMSLCGCIATTTFLSCQFDEPAAPKPTREKGTFPFVLRYEKDGKTHTLEDSVICEYQGRDCDGRGLHNKWRRYYASRSNTKILHQISQSEWVHYQLRECEALMSGNLSESANPVFHILEYDGVRLDLPVLSDELQSKYGIRIISFELSRSEL